MNTSESVSESVGSKSMSEQLSPPPASIKMKKVYDHATKSYTLVAKNPPAKVLVPRKVTSPKQIRKLQMRLIAQYGGSFESVNASQNRAKAFANRVVKRHVKKKLAEKMKWSNYQLQKAGR
jgi:hypothetical protein